MLAQIYAHIIYFRRNHGIRQVAKPGNFEGFPAFSCALCLIMSYIFLDFNKGIPVYINGVGFHPP